MLTTSPSRCAGSTHDPKIESQSPGPLSASTPTWPVLRRWGITLTAATILSPCARAEKTSFEFFSQTGRDLFPSAIISTATVDWSEFQEDYEDTADATDEDAVSGDEADKDATEEAADEPPFLGDANGWIGVSLLDVPKGADITVEMAGDGWLKPSKFTGKAANLEGEALEGDIDVMPKAAWDFEALRLVHEQKPVNLSIKVSVNGKALPEKTETLVLRSLYDCPFFVIHEDPEEIEDMSWCFAAYVNENHPWIDGLLKEALTTAKSADGSALIDSFTGYQSGDEEEVLKQVFAIWQVLQRRGIKYSDVSTSVPSKAVVSQIVRSLDQTVEATQANCVDGSLLMASILTKIGLNADLVMVPGHCFLAFDGDADGESLMGLETTLLGANQLKSVDELKKLELKAEDKKMAPDKLNQMVAKEARTSMVTFLNALETGNACLEKHADEFEDGSDPNAQIISIRDSRELGIMPLASGKERK